MAEFNIPRVKYKDKPTVKTIEDCYTYLLCPKYQSPVEILHQKFNTELEHEVMKVIHSYGIDVDKDELVKALEYDRNQYEQGFIDGCNHNISSFKSEVAREIFEEIEKAFIKYYDEIITYSNPILPYHTRQAAGFALNGMFTKIAELKKKYTEDINHED